MESHSIRRRTRLAVLLLLTIVVVSGSRASAEGAYAVTDLGTLPPPDLANVSFATGIDDSGHVTGPSWGKHAGSFTPHAFRTGPGAPIGLADDLGVLPGGVAAFPYAINSHGHVVGEWSPPYHTFPFWYDGHTMHDLLTPKPYGGSAYALDSHDDVAGVEYSAAFLGGHAAIWPHGGPMPIDLNTIMPPGSGWVLTAAYGINDAGHVVGKGTYGGKLHGFFWSGPGTSVVDLGFLPGGHFSAACGISAKDHVVGYSEAKTGIHGFVWAAGALTDIGTLPGYAHSIAQAVNAAGDVVGWVDTKLYAGGLFEKTTLDPTSHAVLFSHGTLTDLNDLLPAGSGWVLTQAFSINSLGQIVGEGKHKGVVRAFLLSPHSPWSKVATMPTARRWITAVTTKSGDVYLLGGGAPTSGVLAGVDVYHPATDTWSHADPMPSARGLHAAALGPDGLIYVFGGLGPGYEILSSAMAYDPAIHAWHALPPMPHARWGLGAAVGKDGKIYVAGGSVDPDLLYPGAVPTVDCFDPVTKLWSVAASMSSARVDLGVAAGADGLIYAVGGMNKSGTHLGTVEKYDPATHAWTGAPSMPAGRALMSVVTGSDGLFYLVGGFNTAHGVSPPYDSFESYDPKTGAWAELPVMPTSRFRLGASITPEGALLAFGGTDDYVSALTVVEKYTP